MAVSEKTLKENIVIASENQKFLGDLTRPPEATGIVIFAHGSGSSRFSPRNRQVANYLNRFNMATLLLDLLTEEEDYIDDITRQFRFDIDLLGTRLVKAIDWCTQQQDMHDIKIGLFGASTGAAAALMAAAKRPGKVAAVVSRGGRPDLAGAYMDQVKAPTLLIVGGLDDVVIDLNQQASRKLKGIQQLSIIPGASHLFEEPGKLEQVCQLAGDWFRKYF